jgi:hypothetical protein
LSRRGRMVVEFTTTCAIVAYHHSSCEFEPHSWRGVLDTTLCDKVCQWLATGLWISLGFPIALSCTWEGMVILRWRTGQFVQGRSCRLNEMLSFTLHYSINWIYTETDTGRGIVHLMHKRVDPKIHRNSHTNHSKWSKQTK